MMDLKFVLNLATIALDSVKDCPQCNKCKELALQTLSIVNDITGKEDPIEDRPRPVS